MFRASDVFVRGNVYRPKLLGQGFVTNRKIASDEHCRKKSVEPVKDRFTLDQGTPLD
jgi:hypothetical protein